MVSVFKGKDDQGGISMMEIKFPRSTKMLQSIKKALFL